MAELTHENVLAALKQLEALRASTNYVWELLCRGKNDQYPFRKSVDDNDAGIEITNEEKDINENNKDENKDSKDKHVFEKKNYLMKLKNSMKECSQTLIEVENSFSNLPNTPLAIPIISTTLLKDPLSAQSNIPQQTINTYKWFSKMHEQCQIAFTYLSTHLAKRTTHSNTALVRKSRKVTMGYNCPPSSLDQLIKQIGHHFSNLQITSHKPYGPQLNPVVLEIKVSQVLKGMVVMRGLCIENVIIKALDERFTNLDDNKHDFNSSSRYEVFQMITDHAHSFMLNSNTFNLDSTFRQFLMWLNSYRTLFSQPCSRCHKHLRNMLPPTWKEYPSFEPAHLLCLKG